MKQKFAIFIISLAAIIISALPAAANTYKVSTENTLRTAVSKAASETSTNIIISGDISIYDRIVITKDMNITISSSKNVTLRRAATMTKTEALFHVNSGGKLTFSSNYPLTIQGYEKAQIALLYTVGGTLSIGKNINITGNTNTSGNGGAIYVNGGTLNISGGSISGNSAQTNGGAIAVLASKNTSTGVITRGQLNITGGSISGNSAQSNGGAIYLLGSDMSIKDVEISGNTGVLGKGIYIANSTDSQASATLDGTLRISDIIYNKTTVPFKIASGFDKSNYLFLGFANYDIDRTIAECEEPAEAYTDCFYIIGGNYCARPVSSDLTLSKKYIVTFLDSDGTALSSSEVYYGESATAPELLPKTGYKFIGWNKPFDNITDDTKITAQYKKLNNIELFADNEIAAGAYTEDLSEHSITAKAYSDSAALVLAIYQNNVLSGFIICDKDNDQEYSADAKVSFTSGTSVKAMLWENLSPCAPLSEVKKITVEGASE